MYQRTHETAAPATFKRAPAHRTEASEPDVTHPLHCAPRGRVAPSDAGAASPEMHAAALNQASGGQLARAGHALLQLQQQHGNRYVQQVVNHASRGGNPATAPVIQAKLALGPANDACEREADRVARQVVGQVNSEAQRVQQQAEHDHDMVVRRAPDIDRVASVSDGAMHAGVQQAVEQARRGGQALPDHLRGSMEQAFGAEFAGVRVHTHAEADQCSRSLQAQAFTTGRDIFFRRGAYEPESRVGQELIAHELTHVLQQNGGEGRTSDRQLVQRTQTERKRYAPRALGQNDEALVIYEKTNTTGFLRSHQTLLGRQDIRHIRDAATNSRAKIARIITTVDQLSAMVSAGVNNQQDYDTFDGAMTIAMSQRLIEMRCFGIEYAKNGVDTMSGAQYAAYLENDILPWIGVVQSVYRKIATKLSGPLELAEVENIAENADVAGMAINSFAERDKTQSRADTRENRQKVRFDLPGEAPTPAPRVDPTIRPKSAGGAKDAYLLPFNHGVFAYSDPRLYVNYQKILQGGGNVINELEHTIVHEASHVSAATRDNAYQNEGHFFSMPPVQGTANADSYAYFYTNHP